MTFDFATTENREAEALRELAALIAAYRDVLGAPLPRLERGPQRLADVAVSITVAGLAAMTHDAYRRGLEDALSEVTGPTNNKPRCGTAGLLEQPETDCRVDASDAATQ